jgi:hypothetical protein
MNNPNVDLASLIQTLVEKVEQIDKRTNAIATAPNRYWVDAPEAAPKSTRRGRKESLPPPPKSIADQIYDLIQEHPRTEPELSKLIGSPRSSVNQAANELRQQHRAVIVTTGRGRGAMNVVFHPSTKDPFGWLFKHMGWNHVRG